MYEQNKILEKCWQLLKAVMVQHDIDVLWAGENVGAFDELIEIATNAGCLAKATEFARRLEEGKL